MTLSPIGIARQRLRSQCLTAAPLEKPADVVRWRVAAQAQDFAGAKWGRGLRMKSATDAGVQQAFDAGAILRTHVMRPTWHFVTPAAIRWLLELTAPRVHAANALGSALLNIIVVKGWIVGTFKRTLRKSAVTVETRLFAKLTAAEQRALAAAAQRYGAFLEVPVVLAGRLD